ncbi:putative neprosin activation peptide [Helianthus annuus]|nr:putative neprosin activation peptide [Helianthus annuus]
MIDCVHISHQPAFDHPFLKDYKIQMRPNYHPEGLYDENRVSNERENRIKQLWHVSGTCPEDTIPIRRTKEDDVLRASSVKRYGKKKHTISINITPNSADPDLDNESGHQHAIAYME